MRAGGAAGKGPEWNWLERAHRGCGRADGWRRDRAGGARSRAISDRLEHLPPYRDLGHLEGYGAAVADDLGTVLDQVLA
jgi:hypothetical protein